MFSGNSSADEASESSQSDYSYDSAQLPQKGTHYLQNSSSQNHNFRNKNKDSAEFQNEPPFQDPAALIFGYGARLFSLPLVEFEKTKQNTLISWPYSSCNQDLLIDRYDARNLIQDLSTLAKYKTEFYEPGWFFVNSFFPEVRSQPAKKPKIARKRLRSLNYQRFCDFYSDNETNTGSFDAAKPSKAIICKDMPSRSFQAAYYDYSTGDTSFDTLDSQEIQNTKYTELENTLKANQSANFPPSLLPKDASYKANFQAPNDMETPKSKKEFELIEKTAKFIADKPSKDESNRLELTIQGKQATNPSFSFLNKSDPLYPFYCHVKFLVQTGLYGYESESESEPEPNLSSEDSNTPQKSKRRNHKISLNKPADGSGFEPINLKPSDNTVTIPMDIIVPDDANLEKIIVNTATLVVSKQSDLLKAEMEIRIQKSSTSKLYSFLSSTNEYNPFYRFYRDSLASGKVVVASAKTHGSRPGPPGGISKPVISDVGDFNTNGGLAVVQQNKILSDSGTNQSEYKLKGKESNIKLNRRNKLASFLANKRAKLE